MYIYLDLLFLTNAVMDIILLEITAVFSAASLKKGRACLSGVTGGLGGVAFFLCEIPFRLAVCSGVILGGIIVYLAFFPLRCREFFKRLLLFFFASVLLGGLEFFMMMAFRRGMIKNGIAYISFPQLLLCAGIGCGVIVIAQRLIKRRASKTICTVKLEWQTHTITMEGLQDTGNNLTDPLSRKPVILIEERLLKKLIHPNCNLYNLSEWVTEDKIRKIPYQSIDGAGYLTGIVLDAFYIENRKITGVVAAISARELQFPAILNTGL